LGVENVLNQDTIVTGVTFTLNTIEISYLIGREQGDTAQIARMVSAEIDDRELETAHMDLQEYLANLVEHIEVIIRNPPMRQGGGLKTLYRNQQDEGDPVGD